MSDIGLFIDSEGFIDIAFNEGDLKQDDSLQTALLISLFTDKRIEESERPEDEPSLRGFWGDIYADVEGDKIGSKLWLFSRSKRTVETLTYYEDYALEALKWLTEDEIADRVEVSAAYQGEGLLLSIYTYKGTINNKYSVFWDGQTANITEG